GAGPDGRRSRTSEEPDQRQDRSRAGTRAANSRESSGRQPGTGRHSGPRASGTQGRPHDRHERTSGNGNRLSGQPSPGQVGSEGIRRKDQQTSKTTLSGEDQGSSSRGGLGSQQCGFQ